MTVNSHLRELADAAVIRNAEKQSISRSIHTLQQRLEYYFGNELSKHFIFGSYTRGTILPRAMDGNSDIDYMVVFEGSNYKPQTYLDKLRRFVEYYYSSSEITQSNPTIVLTLNHIKFELVPAITDWFHGLQIPAKRADLNDWIDTDPNDINRDLSNANQSNNSLIKPMIRLVKYWNAINNYPFNSFELEKELAERSYIWVSLLTSAQLKDYFFDAVESLSLGWGAAQYKKTALDRAKTIVRQAKSNSQDGYEALALSQIKELLPEVTTAKGALWGL
ncbi:nucleotidyltransferase domain-containing protein [Neiella sp. HB171785]|uniref:Nucleotidyltransferase domain-containing protein n=1 Tax=Neiella litorisoli TaxID=2771431 RepID=A0A8J6QIE5_9GAMM|nr:nucleotidyltransferase domain-containing protein [Neiella litorisoli]MBD1389258.1 nucleotidyltransferase domain-containing protein [Neiella litorisoli]